MDEDDDTVPSGNLAKDDANGLAEMEEEALTEIPAKVEEDGVKPDEVIHEVAVGKGLAGALKILKERGSLNEGTDWGGRTTDKKKSKLIGVEDGPKDIRIERIDEFGRVVSTQPRPGADLGLGPLGPRPQAWPKSTHAPCIIFHGPATDLMKWP